jgi:non-heme chloroperoxidase
VLELSHVTLVGHSIGCAVIARYLTRYGNGRVAGVAFLGTTTPVLRKSDDNPDGVPDEAIRYFQTQQLMQDFPKWADENLPPFLGSYTSPGTSAWLLNMASQASAKALLECNRSLMTTDFTQELTQIDVPALILHGDCDVSTPIALTGYRTAKLIPGAILKEYEGAAHGLFLTHVDRVNADLLQFIGCRIASNEE